MHTFRQKLSTYWIIARSLWATIYYSCLSLYHSFFSTRAQIDTTIRHWAHRLLDIVHAQVHLESPPSEIKPGQAYILMSNHGSLYDIPIIFEALPGSIRMIAKKELFRVPLWGHAMKSCEFLAIDRKNATQAMKDLEVVKEKMQSGIIPWVAPEGTRSRDGKLGVFKKGAFVLAIQTGAMIIPVGIRGAAGILPPKTLDFQMHQDISVHIGTPVDASAYSLQTRGDLLQVVQAQIKTLAGLD